MEISLQEFTFLENVSTTSLDKKKFHVVHFLRRGITQTTVNTDMFVSGYLHSKSSDYGDINASQF